MKVMSLLQEFAVGEKEVVGLDLCMLGHCELNCVQNSYAEVVVKTTIKGTSRTFIYLMASTTDVNESVPGGCEGPVPGGQ